MGKLHSLLAVESDLRVKAGKVIGEAITTFTKRDEHFDGMRRDYKPFLEEEKGMTEYGESKAMVTTVAEKLQYIEGPIQNALNAVIAKEETNCSGAAKAELKVGSVSFGELSATSLLALEKELSRLREVYLKIPTLDPAKEWKRDEREDGVQYITAPSTTIRTQKIEEFVTAYEATEHHPAQVAKVTNDKPIGKYETTYMSGKLFPLKKSQLLEKIDKLIQAVKKARSEANSADVVKVEIGDKIFEYIHEDLTK